MSAQNREKLTSPPLCPQNVRTGSTPLLSCPCGHTMHFEKSGVLRQKVWMSASEESPSLFPPYPKTVRAGQTPSLLTTDVFYGQPLTTRTRLMHD